MGFYLPFRNKWGLASALPPVAQPQAILALAASIGLGTGEGNGGWPKPS